MDRPCVRRNDSSLSRADHRDHNGLRPLRVERVRGGAPRPGWPLCGRRYGEVRRNRPLCTMLDGILAAYSRPAITLWITGWAVDNDDRGTDGNKLGMVSALKSYFPEVAKR
ncbi:hypothetical protein BD311DRAFT_676443 [Dichomitus squalens]|uniref:Uncharacterized protein n=1 Tax=Dichomitus squalens TaxID=114155 RepID=A0A4V6MVR8_9APHY|nr:hypothetical protein BD311DRAFT_676443 [Dichomitus squalens]